MSSESWHGGTLDLVPEPLLASLHGGSAGHGAWIPRDQGKRKGRSVLWVWWGKGKDRWQPIHQDGAGSVACIQGNLTRSLVPDLLLCCCHLEVHSNFQTSSLLQADRGRWSSVILSPETLDFSQELISQPAPFVGKTYSFPINNLGMLVKRSIDHKCATLFLDSQYSSTYLHV